MWKNKKEAYRNLLEFIEKHQLTPFMEYTPNIIRTLACCPDLPVFHEIFLDALQYCDEILGVMSQEILRDGENEIFWGILTKIRESKEILRKLYLIRIAHPGSLEDLQSETFDRNVTC